MHATFWSLANSYICLRTEISLTTCRYIYPLQLLDFIFLFDCMKYEVYGTTAFNVYFNKVITKDVLRVILSVLKYKQQ